MRLDTTQHFVKGGDSGSLIEPPGFTESLLGKRLTLPLDDEDHMPPDGKPQLSADQLAILKWWLDAGAPTDKTILELKPTPELLQQIKSMLGASASDPARKK